MRWMKLCGCSVCLLLMFVGISKGASDIPLEVFGQLPSLENMAISPEGTHVAFTRTTAEGRYVYVVSLEDMSAVGRMDLGEVKLRDIKWSDNDHILFTSSSTGMPDELSGADTEFFLLRSYDINTGKHYNPIRASSTFTVMNVVIGGPMLRRIDDRTLIYVAGIYITDRTFPALFELNIDNGSSKVVEIGASRARGWLVDEKGVVVASETYDEMKQRWGIHVLKNGKMTEALSGEAAIEHPTIDGFSPSGDALWIHTMENNDHVWKPLSMETGTLGEPLEQLKGFESLATDPYTDRIFGGRPIGTDSDFVFFDQQLQTFWESLQEAFQDERVDLASASRDFQKLVVLVDGPVFGYCYYMVDRATMEAVRIGDVYEGLSRIAEVRSFAYPAGDGLTIPAYLTLPPGREEKDLPLVVMPHGGPAVRDSGRFDWWAQALASQGYAVLQPNFRGSDLGWEFMSAGFGEWGRKMQTDLSDGVRYLIEKGIVDKNRVCIVGASYGGYAALAGATMDPGVYCCAVSVAGISDLSKMYSWIYAKKKRSDTISERYLDRFLGASGSKDPILATLSPRERAGETTVPILLIHGRDDTVVPFKQSNLMAKALKRAGKTVEFIKLDGEDHWLSRNDTRLQMLESTVAFLRKYNPPD